LSFEKVAQEVPMFAEGVVRWFSPVVVFFLFAFPATPLLAESRTEQVAPNLALGSVRVLGSATCPPDAAKGAKCTSIRVSCAGLADIDAVYASAATVLYPKGTIILHSGAGGTTFLNEGFADTYTADRFRVVQVAWRSDWTETNGVGLKSGACRPATFFKYVFDTVHKSSRTGGFCGQGISGGSAALTYALAHYGMDTYFDYAVLAAGPAIAKVDYGCDSNLYNGGARNLCSLLSDAPFTYPSGGAVNHWEHTSTCTSASPLQRDINKMGGGFHRHHRCQLLLSQHGNELVFLHDHAQPEHGAGYVLDRRSHTAQSPP
jgi:hypothetical protein